MRGGGGGAGAAVAASPEPAAAGELALTAVAGLESRGRRIEAARRMRTAPARLHIGEKTVEKHLSQVSGKLAISGRAAIGAKLAQRRKGQGALLTDADVRPPQGASAEDLNLDSTRPVAS